jgi:dihydrolipoamide dehydrogenase
MYHVLVIGGGPGGYAAAIRVSQLGGRAALVEADEMGGTCVNRGCIPTKVWQRGASLLHRMKTAQEFGIQAALEGLDLNALKARKDGVAGDIRMGMDGLLQNNGVDLISGHGTVKGPGEVEVDGRILKGEKIILATGSVPTVPDVPGLKDAVLTTDEALDSIELPKTMLVWGSGPIEVEMATFFQIFGTKVYLATSDTRIVSREDSETSQRLAQGLRELGIDIHTRQQLTSVRPADDTFEAVLSGRDEKNIRVDHVLVGSRRPNTALMGLEQTGINVSEDGGIQINERLETNLSGVYAAGDCTGGWMLSHAASAMAITAAENAMGQEKRFPFRRIPRGIWSIPEVGAVGLSEEEAEEQGYEVETGSFPLAINGLSMARNEMGGAVKVVFDTRYGEILGVHIVGAQATDVIGQAGFCMQLEGSIREMAAGIQLHPTISEAVVDASREALGWALYLPRN